MELRTIHCNRRIFYGKRYFEKTSMQPTTTLIVGFCVFLNVACVFCVVLLVQKVVSVDLSEAAEEGQRAQSVGMSDPHVSGHPLDQTRETLQLCHHVV